MEAKHTSPHCELPWGNSFHSLADSLYQTFVPLIVKSKYKCQHLNIHPSPKAFSLKGWWRGWSLSWLPLGREVSHSWTHLQLICVSGPSPGALALDLFNSFWLYSTALSWVSLASLSSALLASSVLWCLRRSYDLGTSGNIHCFSRVGEYGRHRHWTSGVRGPS